MTEITSARAIPTINAVDGFNPSDFTRELTRLFRQLSPRLFAKEGDRQRLVDAAQEHLDGLIAQENEQEEAPS